MTEHTPNNEQLRLLNNFMSVTNVLLVDNEGNWLGAVIDEETRDEIMRRWNFYYVMLEALEIATTALEVVYKSDPENIAAKVCIERNKEAIRKAKSDE